MAPVSGCFLSGRLILVLEYLLVPSVLLGTSNLAYNLPSVGSSYSLASGCILSKSLKCIPKCSLSHFFKLQLVFQQPVLIGKAANCLFIPIDLDWEANRSATGGDVLPSEWVKFLAIHPPSAFLAPAPGRGYLGSDPPSRVLPEPCPSPHTQHSLMACWLHLVPCIGTLPSGGSFLYRLSSQGKPPPSNPDLGHYPYLGGYYPYFRIQPALALLYNDTAMQYTWRVPWAGSPQYKATGGSLISVWVGIRDQPAVKKILDLG
ncbi:hypothetical protein DSO57_1017692 [Entomophthora muscae]|uniref:Uncharacterized protein n=1 Tax=Entomophthora muscae TaxID=34485 RepID=A0ACC2T4E9_9FUNG|nr:hypothetical protein DSO57_1017692 [Entomophthora muscae]